MLSISHAASLRASAGYVLHGQTSHPAARAFPRRLPPPGHERREPDRRKARQRYRRAGTNSESFVRLFLTLGENTLDYLSRINK